MLLPRLGALLFAASYAHALKDTSPFFLVSSDPLPADSPLKSTQYAHAQTLEDQIVELLSSCDKTWYTIYENPGVSASDLAAMPKLSSKIQGVEKQRIAEIPHVMGREGLSAQRIRERLEEACVAKEKVTRDGSIQGAKDDAVKIMTLPQSPLPLEKKARREVLARTDEVLAHNIGVDLEADSAVVIYITTPATSTEQMTEEGRVYEMDEPYPEAPHMDLKRDTGLHRRQDSDDDAQAGLPLFEKYQFLSPPIFMGLSVSLLLLLILSVGVRAISGLDVSYMAFNKEMGPNAQKPKQQ